MQRAININIMIKIAINLDCNQDRIGSIYKIKDKGTRFRK